MCSSIAESLKNCINPAQIPRLLIVICTLQFLRIKLAQLVPLSYFRGRSTCYSDRLHDFSVSIPGCYSDVYVNSFFCRTARLWSSLPIECFPLIYDPGCYNDVYVNGFFRRTARLWSSLLIECFPLIYDLNDFKSRINRHLLTVNSF